MKKIISIILIITAVIALCSCGNRDMFDTNFTFDYVLVRMPDNTMKKIEIKQWRTYDDGEQIQIISKDGKVYLINSVNSVLVRE